uniref:Uncharacterized protein n=1 Tax=Glossina austeni TaxID=7395 RepID=A0A1A9VIZ6_GLOAU
MEQCADSFFEEKLLNESIIFFIEKHRVSNDSILDALTLMSLQMVSLTLLAATPTKFQQFLGDNNEDEEFVGDPNSIIVLQILPKISAEILQEESTYYTLVRHRNTGRRLFLFVLKNELPGVQKKNNNYSFREEEHLEKRVQYCLWKNV